jgi:methionine aminopeptidase
VPSLKVPIDEPMESENEEKVHKIHEDFEYFNNHESPIKQHRKESLFGVSSKSSHSQLEKSANENIDNYVITDDILMSQILQNFKSMGHKNKFACLAHPENSVEYICKTERIGLCSK